MEGERQANDVRSAETDSDNCQNDAEQKGTLEYVLLVCFFFFAQVKCYFPVKLHL